MTYSTNHYKKKLVKSLQREVYSQINHYKEKLDKSLQQKLEKLIISITCKLVMQPTPHHSLSLSPPSQGHQLFQSLLPEYVYMLFIHSTV